MKKFLKSKMFILAIMVVLSCSMSSVAFANEGIANGTYSIDVISSAAMFKVVDAKVNALDGNMSAVITLSGTGYSKLFMGTMEEADVANEDDIINFVVDEEGKYTYNIPVSALDTEIDVAAYSDKNQIWYDRTLTFDSTTLAAIETQQSQENAEEQKTEENIVEEPVEETEKSTTAEEVIPKTGDNNMVVISAIVLLLCVGIIIKDKKSKMEV